MKGFTSTSSLLLASAATLLSGGVGAAPLSRRAVTDVDILQYALTLEHLENVFYKQALSAYPRDQFLAAGFSSAYYDNLKYIAHDEESHVEALTQALQAAGAQPVAACSYKFPFTDPKSFIALSSILEGVGTSAYLGGAGLISNPKYLTVAGSILVTEAKHTSLQRYTIGEIGIANPYGTPMGINEVYTLAAAFITGCPSTNAALPVKAFPNLVAVQGLPTAPGITFDFAPPSGVTLPAGGAGLFVTFASGLDLVSMPVSMVNGNLRTTIPTVASGQTYAVLTSTNVTSALTDDVVLAGPAILEVTPNSPTFDTSIL